MTGLAKRMVCWFSCGAPSAVASMLAIKKYGATHDVVVANCQIKEEHPDNDRFLKDCEEWFGQKAVRLGNDNYGRSVEVVCRSVKYIVSPSGAPCTGKLKKDVRLAFQRPGDIHVFGYTTEERDRVDRFIDANSDIEIIPILIDAGLTKADCKGIIDRAGIKLPEMYLLGYENANCIGCVKGSAGYWNKVRVTHPEVYERRARLEEEIGGIICKIAMSTVKKKYPEIYKTLECPPLKNENGGDKYWRPTLRELPEDAGDFPREPQIECGIFCEMAEQDIRGF